MLTTLQEIKALKPRSKTRLDLAQKNSMPSLRSSQEIQAVIFVKKFVLQFLQWKILRLLENVINVPVPCLAPKGG